MTWTVSTIRGRTEFTDSEDMVFHILESGMMDTAILNVIQAYHDPHRILDTLRSERHHRVCDLLDLLLGEVVQHVMIENPPREGEDYVVDGKVLAVWEE